MKISIQMLSIESTELFFLFDYQHQPVIEVNGIQYTSLRQLLDILPQLHHPQHLEKLAQIANFLAKGLEFQHIEDIELFKESYYQQIEAAQSSLLDDGPKLKDYGIFDLSAMHPPCLKKEQLVFFVKHDFLLIPYQATLFQPIENDLLHMAYEILPLLATSGSVF